MRSNIPQTNTFWPQDPRQVTLTDINCNPILIKQVPSSPPPPPKYRFTNSYAWQKGKHNKQLPPPPPLPPKYRFTNSYAWQTSLSHFYTPYSGNDHSKQPQIPTHDKTPLTHKQSQIPTHDKTTLSHTPTHPIRVKIILNNHTFLRMTPHTHTPLGWEKDKTRHDKTPRPHFHHFFGVILTPHHPF